jgi:hypothetical protein
MLPAPGTPHGNTNQIQTYQLLLDRPPPPPTLRQPRATCTLPPTLHSTVRRNHPTHRPHAPPPTGMDFYVCLERPGYRVARRRKCNTRVGVQHRVTKEDAIKWFQVGGGGSGVWGLMLFKSAPTSK